MAPDHFPFSWPAARRLLAGVLALAMGVAYADCVNDVKGLRRIAEDTAFPLHWIETGMDDGRPLRLILSEREGTLHFQFDKTPAGLWAEGLGEICSAVGSLEVHFSPGALHPGPTANWLLRRRLEAGTRLLLARLKSGELQVSTFGWQTRFAAVASHTEPHLHGQDARDPKSSR